MPMLTLELAKKLAGITTAPGDPDDDVLQFKLEAAEALVLNYLKDEAPDPSPVIRIAIGIQFVEFHRFRGDDVEGQGPAQTLGHLSPAVTNYLRMFRDPTLA
jgi:hypothetical protein